MLIFTSQGCGQPACQWGGGHHQHIYRQSGLGTRAHQTVPHQSNYRGSHGAYLATIPGQGTPCSLRCPGTPHNLRLYGFQASVPEYGQISTHLPADVKEWNPSFHYFLQKVLFYFISTTICVLYLKYSINGPN